MKRRNAETLKRRNAQTPNLANEMVVANHQLPSAACRFAQPATHPLNIMALAFQRFGVSAFWRFAGGVPCMC